MFRSVFNNFTKAIRRNHPFIKAFNKQAFVVSSLLGASLYLTNNNIKSAKAQTEQQPQSQGEKSEEGQFIQWVEFSDEKYEQAVKEGKNVIIFLEPSRFKESFVKEIEAFLENVNAFQHMVKARPIVFMRVEFSEQNSLNSFMNKYKVDIEEETLFLFKNRYLDLSPFSFNEYFGDKDAIVKYFREINQLNKSNEREFINSLEYITSETTLIVAYIPKDDPNYERLHERFGALSLLKTYSENKNLHFLLLNDQETAKNIGLNDVKTGDIHLVARKSKMCYNQSTHDVNGVKLNIRKYGNLKDKMVSIIEKANKTYNEMNVFTGRSFDLDARYSLVLELDENRLQKQDRKKLIQLFSDFHKVLREKEPELYKNVQFVYVKRANEDKKWNIYIRDDYRYGQKIKQHSVKTREELESLDLKDVNDKPHSFIFDFPAKTTTPDVVNLTEWVRTVQNGTAQESFKSQKKPFYRKYSKKLVGKSFEKEVQNNERDQVVFFYSKHCHACKQYGAHYENLALEYLRNDHSHFPKVEFNRMNSDRNSLKTAPNFPFTPVFMVYKKEDKTNPIMYSNTIFTPQELRIFIENTISYKILDVEKFNSHIETVKKTDLSGIFEPVKH
ncbi:thioredoxin (macronuclear) [Tetrahymena thermophila SB210]|uniref:Thioredoxin n=1 Tax=Tetrahymena thermophila (strain SB210) TaxID=312017 RepID=Q22E46_TETTS|nr:thioredoxin [Tetrahymena thermophila SB210]EAR83568.3 thioredoxin [Tetrahymena thermophila SB210]|eukprot:XP_001031231.3 thioredoxin [Tetrahymena thermophila SB210]